jgi:peptidoglycan/LPS O-acetylase OafA/YrhL
MRVEQVGRAEKLLGLEVLRFVSAVAVLFWHYQNFWNTPHGLVGFERDQQPLYRYFSAFYEFGRYGVQVFWSISGYIFFWKYRDAIAKRLTSGRKFFFLRFSRLYPLHFATLLLVAALQGLYFNQTGDIFGKGHGVVARSADLSLFRNAMPEANSVQVRWRALKRLRFYSGASRHLSLAGRRESHAYFPLSPTRNPNCRFLISRK